MLNHESFDRLIDRKQIAVGGHSLGGYTALGLCGTIKERHDARIRAVLLFSTGAGGYLFTQEELGKVRMPSMLYIGQRERNQKRGAQTMSALAHKIYSSMSPPKYFLEVKGANHFAFNNRFADNLRTRLLSGTEEQFEVIRRYSIAFLEKHVAGNRDSGLVLERSDPMLSRYIFMQSNPTEEDPLSSKSFSVYSGSGCFHL
jgi:predicted dienelactone hydrolase